MRFRKKPIVIEAHVWSGGVADPWGAVCVGCNETHMYAHVHTLEGPLKLSEGDWIIRGVKGEFYPCKPDVFVATYEPVEENQA